MPRMFGSWNLVTLDDFLMLPGVVEVIEMHGQMRLVLKVGPEWVLPYKAWFAHGGEGWSRCMVNMLVDVEEAD